MRQNHGPTLWIIITNIYKAPSIHTHSTVCGKYIYQNLEFTTHHGGKLYVFIRCSFPVNYNLVSHSTTTRYPMTIIPVFYVPVTLAKNLGSLLFLVKYCCKHFNASSSPDMAWLVSCMQYLSVYIICFSLVS